MVFLGYNDSMLIIQVRPEFSLENIFAVFAAVRWQLTLDFLLVSNHFVRHIERFQRLVGTKESNALIIFFATNKSSCGKIALVAIPPLLLFEKWERHTTDVSTSRAWSLARIGIRKPHRRDHDQDQGNDQATELNDNLLDFIPSSCLYTEETNGQCLDR